MTTNDPIRDRLITPVAIVVLVVWMGSFVFSTVSGQFTSLEVTTPLMLMLAGYVFGVSITRGGTGSGNGR